MLTSSNVKLDDTTHVIHIQHGRLAVAAVSKLWYMKTTSQLAAMRVHCSQRGLGDYMQSLSLSYVLSVALFSLCTELIYPALGER